MLKQKNQIKSSNIVKEIILEQKTRVKLFCRKEGIPRVKGVFTTSHFMELNLEI